MMDIIPTVRDRDVRSRREYRTKRLIPEIDDDPADAIATGRRCQIRFDLTPAASRVATPAAMREQRLEREPM